MSQSKDATTDPPRPPPKKLHYVDNCRSCLTALVILHHAACSYGGIGRNTYQSRFNAQGSSAALVGLNAFNQSFVRLRSASLIETLELTKSQFMGTYMYLGGYFSRRALERKSRENFIKDRIYRLGLPTLAYTAIGAPLCAGIVRVWQGQSIDLHWLISYWREQRGIRGPVWFTGTLLCFDLALVAYDRIQNVLYTDSSDGPPPPATTKDNEKINQLKLYASIALCSASDVFIRTLYPVGTIVNPLKLQPAYLSQYIAAYILGANVPSFSAGIPSRTVRRSLLLISLATGSILLHNLRRDPTARSATQQMFGGYNTLAAVYALWNNINGYLVGSAVLAAFETYTTESWGNVNKLAFPAFLVHMPVLTLLGVVTDEWEMGGAVVKTAVVGVLGIVGSWGVGYFGDWVWGWGKGVIGGGRKEV